MQNHIYVPKFGTLKGTLFIIAVAVALCVGLSLASPAHGAGARQDAQGDISGTVTLGNQGAAGVTVELRKRNNSGEDVALVSAKSDTNGMYHFANQPSAPNDAFYYVRFLGTNGSLAVWYSFPIIYISGSQVSVPSVELSDVELASPEQNATVQLPATLKWKARKTGETYRIFVYADGKTDKPLLDSGSLGTNTEFTIGEAGLADGKYEAVVQVRDTVVGYGQSQSRFRFSVGAAPVQAPTEAPAEGNTTTPPAAPGTTQGAQDTPQQGSTAA